MKKELSVLPSSERLLIPLTVVYFLILAIWWVFIFLGKTTDAPVNHIFGFIYGSFSIWGAVWAFTTAYLWGGKSSYLGRAVLSLALGLACQAFGQYSFWFYNYFLKVAVPYPGIPDIGYFGTVLFYFYAAFQLAKVTGVKLNLQSFKEHSYSILIPVGMIVIAFVLFLHNYTFDISHPLKTFLDYGYPLGQAMYISIVLLVFSLSRKLLGGIMRKPILILLFAFGAQFFCDYLFIYFAQDYFPASFIDFFYLFSYFMMTIAILNIRKTAVSLKK